MANSTVAPAPAPAATATGANPNPTEKTSSPEQAVVDKPFKETFAAIDDLEALENGPGTDIAPAPPKASPPKPSKAPAPPAKPEPPKEATPAKVEPPKAEPTDDGAKVDLDTVTEVELLKLPAHDLRIRLRRQLKQNSTLQEEVQRLRSVPSDHEKTTRALGDENKTLKERIEKAEERLRYLDYTQSDEYKEKFEKPFADAMEDAYADVRELWVSTPDGQERPANEKDLDRIIDASDQEVRKLAKDMFGESSADVLSIRRKIRDMRRNASREAQRYREQGKAREQQRITEQQEQRAVLSRHWDQCNEAIPKKYPEYFGEVEGDDEGNAELKKGLARVDAANDPRVPFADRVAKQAAIRWTSAAFWRERLRRLRAEARSKELEESLAAYDKSVPGEGEPHPAKAGETKSETVEEEIVRLAKEDGD